VIAKNSCPCWESNPSHPVCSPVTILTGLPQLQLLRGLDEKGYYAIVYADEIAILI
jgi:hypothetical protein